MTTKHNPEGAQRNKRWASCGHPHCSDCKTKRGRNFGNRRIRKLVNQLLRTGRNADAW